MLPKIIYHIGCSVDGRIDWMKPDNFLYYRLIQDWKIDATISGSNTILKAEMSYDQDIKKLNDQFLVVVDSKGKINNWDIIKRQAWWNNTPIVLCSNSTPDEYLNSLRNSHIEYLIHGKTHVDLKSALEELYSKFGIKVLCIDSGGILGGVLLRLNLVYGVGVLFSPQMTGGQSVKSIYVAPDLTSIHGVIDLQLLKHEIIDYKYVFLNYRVIKQG